MIAPTRDSGPDADAVKSAEPYTFKDIVTRKIRRTRGAFSGFVQSSVFGFTYAVFRNRKTDVLVPVHCLTPETTARIGKPGLPPHAPQGDSAPELEAYAREVTAAPMSPQQRYEAAQTASQAAQRFTLEISLTDDTRTLQAINDAVERALSQYGRQHDGTLWPVAPGIAGAIEDQSGTVIGRWSVLGDAGQP